VRSFWDVGFSLGKFNFFFLALQIPWKFLTLLFLLLLQIRFPTKWYPIPKILFLLNTLNKSWFPIIIIYLQMSSYIFWNYTLCHSVLSLFLGGFCSGFYVRIEKSVISASLLPALSSKDRKMLFFSGFLVESPFHLNFKKSVK